MTRRRLNTVYTISISRTKSDRLSVFFFSNPFLQPQYTPFPLLSSFLSFFSILIFFYPSFSRNSSDSLLYLHQFPPLSFCPPPNRSTIFTSFLLPFSFSYPSFIAPYILSEISPTFFQLSLSASLSAFHHISLFEFSSFFLDSLSHLSSHFSFSRPTFLPLYIFSNILPTIFCLFFFLPIFISIFLLLASISLSFFFTLFFH